MKLYMKRLSPWLVQLMTNLARIDLEPWAESCDIKFNELKDYYLYHRLTTIYLFDNKAISIYQKKWQPLLQLDRQPIV